MRVWDLEFGVQGLGFKQTSTVRAAKSISRKALEERVWAECGKDQDLGFMETHYGRRRGWGVGSGVEVLEE